MFRLSPLRVRLEINHEENSPLEKTQTEMPVLEIDCDDCRPPADNRPDLRPGITSLVDAISIKGQLIPALVCPHPELPGKYLILDGAGRWFACSQLGIKLRAVLLPSAVPEEEQIKLLLHTNAFRRRMGPDEIADAAERFMKLSGATQEQTAKELSISKASLSRAFSKKQRIPAHLQPLASRVKVSIATGVATLKSVDAMEKTLVFATTPGPDKRLPTREEVAAFQEQFQERKRRGPKLKLIRGEPDGRKLEFSVDDGETGESLIEFFRNMADRLKKARVGEAPAEGLGYLFVD